MKLYYKFSIYNRLFANDKNKLEQIIAKLGHKITIIEQGTNQYLCIDIVTEMSNDDILALGLLIGSVINR